MTIYSIILLNNFKTKAINASWDDVMDLANE